MLQQMIISQVREWVKENDFETVCGFIRQYVVPECSGPMLLQLLELIIQEVGLPVWLSQASTEDLEKVFKGTDAATLLKLDEALTKVLANKRALLDQLNQVESP